MAGGLMQLVAYGAQDVYLTGNPQITFFKVVYRRHTNFAIECVEGTFNGTANFSQRVTHQVSRNGDLMHRVYLKVDLPAMTQSAGTVNWTRDVGNHMINDIELEIGSQRVDKHYGQWMHIYSELTQTAELQDTYDICVGNTTDLTTPAASIPAATLYVPLKFWFCRNPGLALPLVALQYHDVRFHVQFRAASECYITDDNLAPTSGTPSLSDAKFLIDYIYLDTDERRQFAQVQHEYLIEQVQFNNEESISSASPNIKFNFNHPCKELIWTIQLDANVNSGANRWGDYTDSGATLANAYIGNDPLATALLKLNGHDRFRVQSAAYFNLVQPLQHHTRGPATGIYVYSFALNPEQHQPSGSVNMSRIDNTNLVLTTTIGSSAAKLRLYAVNYNVLRIMAGMGGLAYAS